MSNLRVDSLLRRRDRTPDRPHGRDLSSRGLFPERIRNFDEQKIGSEDVLVGDDIFLDQTDARTEDPVDLNRLAWAWALVDRPGAST